MTWKDRTYRIAFWGLVGLAVLVSVLCIVSLASGNGQRGEASTLLRRFRQETHGGKPKEAATTKPTEKKPAPGKDNPKKEKDPREKRICDRNVFGVKKKWSGRLIGVLGDLAFFEKGPGLKVGQSYNGAKIMKIGPDWVELEVEDKPRKLHVFTPGSAGPSPGPMMRRGPGRRSGRTMPPGFQFTPEMIERFKKMPASQRERALQHLPPEAREKLKKSQ